MKAYRWFSLFVVLALLMGQTFANVQTASAAFNLFSENFTTFTGNGFTSTPAAGQLDSDVWIVTGFSDGNGSWGGTNTSGDFARGASSGGVTTGGIYGFNTGSGNIIFGVQPGGDDFTPGSIQLRVQNTTGSTLGSIDVSYKIWVRNDQGRSNSLNFSYSIDDGTTWQSVSALDFATPQSSSGTTWNSTNRSTTISDVSIANNAYIYFRWYSDDVSGSGSRDEYGIDDISITGQPIPYHSITLDANISEWGTTEKLGNAGGTDFYVTWDDDFWYFGVNGGFSHTDFFMIGIDSDPDNETTNTGGTAARCGATFPSENKPNYILVNRQNSYTRESWGWNSSGSVWEETAWNPAETSEYDFSGTSGTYEVKLKKSTVFGTDEDTSPVAFYLWLSNDLCEIFNAWPSENRNGWTGSEQFLYAHSRFDSTDSGHTPNTYGARVAWATNTLSTNSTTYNYFGEDDSSGGNPWLRLTTTASGAGGASCTVRAKMVGTNSFTQPTFEGINRFVEFTLTNCTNLEVDVQMRYEESELNGIYEDDTTFYRCAAAPCSSDWIEVVGGSYTSDLTNNYLRLTDVAQNQFSFWTIGDTNTPTALTLTDFTASSAMNTALLASLALIMLGVSAAALRRRM